MTELERNTAKALLELFYEPDVHEGSREKGEYGGFDVERRFVIKSQDSADCLDQGIELFTTTVNGDPYVGVYRTWECDGEDSEGGVIDAMIRLNLKNEYPCQRISEFERLLVWVNAITTYWKG